jgi:methionine-rich copper-binding protein CopC
MQAVNRWRERRRSSSLSALPLAVLLALLSAAPAAAHAELIDTVPADGGRLTTVPAEVSLTFSEDVLKLGASLAVNGPGGRAKTGAATVHDRTVSWPVTGELAAGRYTATWRITSADGHPVAGTFGFVLAAAQPTAEPTAAPTSDPAVVAGSSPTFTPHTAEPQMTGPMPGMEGMPGMATRSATPAKGSPKATALAIAGLLLLTALMIGAIVIERGRRSPSEEDRSTPASD